MFSDSIIALIRTAVPALVGTLLAVLINWGIQIDQGQADTLSAALIPICISAYYALVTYLERKVNPNFGWLLGNPKTPTYSGDKTDEGIGGE